MKHVTSLFHTRSPSLHHPRMHTQLAPTQTPHSKHSESRVAKAPWWTAGWLTSHHLALEQRQTLSSPWWLPVSLSSPGALEATSPALPATGEEARGREHSTGGLKVTQASPSETRSARRGRAPEGGHSRGRHQGGQHRQRGLAAIILKA